MTRLSFAEIFGIRKLKSLGYRVALFAFSVTIGRSSTGTAVKIDDFRQITRHNSRMLTGASIVNLVVSVEHRLVTDRQTHDYGMYRPSMASRGKTRLKLCFEHDTTIRWGFVSPAANKCINL